MSVVCACALLHHEVFIGEFRRIAKHLYLQFLFKIRTRIILCRVELACEGACNIRVRRPPRGGGEEATFPETALHLWQSEIALPVQSGSAGVLCAASVWQGAEETTAILEDQKCRLVALGTANVFMVCPAQECDSEVLTGLFASGRRNDETLPIQQAEVGIAKSTTMQ